MCDFLKIDNYSVAFSSEPNQLLMKGVKRVRFMNCRDNNSGTEQYNVLHIHVNYHGRGILYRTTSSDKTN